MALHEISGEREAVYTRAIARPRAQGARPKERWELLGYPDLESHRLVERRLLRNRQRLWRRRRARLPLFKSSALDRYKPFEPGLFES
jgi:hypothetical protein